MVTVWRENPQVNRDGGDAFVGACYPVGLGLDFCAHLVEINKFLPFAVQEFRIFCTQNQKDVRVGRLGREGQKRTKKNEIKGENIRFKR